MQDGLVQRVKHFSSNSEDAEEIKITEKFRYRADKLKLKITDIQASIYTSLWGWFLQLVV